MKKNDKLIVVLGVIILVIASIGIYYWEEEVEEEIATRDDILSSSGTIIESKMPEAIKVSNSSHFYAIIATPLAVHYDNECNQEIVPLYIEDFDNPSKAVTRLWREQLAKFDVEEFNYESPKDFSLALAKDYWSSSDAVLLIKDDQEGYNLGLAATPIASYLSIPVIVTNEICQKVKDVLNDLDVEYSIICGDLDGYGKSFELDDIDEIMDLTIDLIRTKFEEDVKYITITNPRDAYPPEIVTDASNGGVTNYTYDGKMRVSTFLPSTLLNMFKPGSEPIKFKIPEDYKYARVIFEIINQEPAEYIEKFGDNMMMASKFTSYITSGASPPILDSSGELLHDRLYYEDTFYDCGGMEFEITPAANVLTNIIPEYTATVRIENLENPYQPLLRQVSSLAPYLTAYHKGIIFAKPEFAFAVDDDNVEFKGEILRGTVTPRKNPKIMPVINIHVYENIHEPLNDLLAKITDINISKNVKALREHCYDNPFYIALVGDATMLPQYYYRSPHSDPWDDTKLRTTYGTNTPSDFIYANIDPDMYLLHPPQLEQVEDDLYSDFPEMENIVGRITGGFDVQDTSALIARTVFYNDVLETQSKEWKENALVMSGAGLEFQALPFVDWLYRLTGMEEPMKWPSGQQHFLAIRTQDFMKEHGGFTVEKLERGQAQSVGFSKEALEQIKKESGLLSRLLFPRLQIQLIQGLENIQSLFSPNWWKQAFEDQAGIHGMESQENSNLIQVNAHGIFFDYSPGDVQMYASGGPFWQLISRVITPALPIPVPRSGLENHGGFAVREVSLMEMGPSVMFVECCGGGKIDSLSPLNTLSAAYLHAGLNAFICPTTLSAISGYLEPRHFRVSYGIPGYIKTWLDTRRGEYTPAEFCGWIFEHSYEEMFKNDATLGEALRNARNGYLYDQFDETYLWTPPLCVEETGRYQGPTYMKSTSSTSSHVPVEKYAAIYQLNLLGDPMWNPYQPVNEG